jgi:hypothetical protein
MHPKEENLTENNPYGFRKPYKEIINEIKLKFIHE